MLHEQAMCACEKVQASKLDAAQWTPALRKMPARRAANACRAVHDLRRLQLRSVFISTRRAAD
jgi:hypothetical protein